MIKSCRCEISLPHLLCAERLFAFTIFILPFFIWNLKQKSKEPTCCRSANEEYHILNMKLREYNGVRYIKQILHIKNAYTTRKKFSCSMLEKFYIGVNFKNVNLVQTLRHKYNSRSKNTSPKKNSLLQPYIISQLCPVGAVMPMLF